MLGYMLCYESVTVVVRENWCVLWDWYWWDSFVLEFMDLFSVKLHFLVDDLLDSVLLFDSLYCFDYVLTDDFTRFIEDIIISFASSLWCFDVNSC